jgi:hypothetical protein
MPTGIFNHEAGSTHVVQKCTALNVMLHPVRMGIQRTAVRLFEETWAYGMPSKSNKVNSSPT